MKKPIAALLLSVSVLFCIAQKNISLLGHLPYASGVTCSNLTSYVDSAGHEYALVGNSLGLSIVAIDTPTNPHQVFFVPGATGNSGFWREVREYKGYAYVTTEQNSGLIVVDLRNLPDTIRYHLVAPNGMHTSHTIFIDENGIAYVNGTDKDQLFLDLNANPWNPTYLGKFTNNYVHDCFVRNDTMWAACINDGIIKVIDVRNKTTADAPGSLIAEWRTPLDFAHNCWLSDDSRYLFTTDEKPNSTLTCYDVSDLNNVTEVDKAQVQPGTNTIIHNTYFQNNYNIASYYTYGVAIFDVTRKNNLVEVGNFDTSPNFDGDGFHGQWGVWPYLPSGNIICSDMETGLWILKPTYQRAAYLEGVVKDSICQTLLTNVKIEILGDSVVDYTRLAGAYTMGTVDSGTYTIRYSHPGYQTIDVPNVHMVNGALTTINISLLPVSTSRLVIKTIDGTTGNALSNARLLIRDNAGVTYDGTSTGSSGERFYCNFVQGQYNFFAGKWGRITELVSKNITQVDDTVILVMDKGYYDDFIMDYGWTVTSTANKGAWERDSPIGTEYNTPDDCNPGSDVAGDLGVECYTTGNGGGNAGDDDVDNGATILCSPIFDLSDYGDPYLSYYRWFFNDGGNGGAPNDSLQVILSNGTDSVFIDMADLDSVQSQWVYKNFRVKDLISLSNNMRIQFKTADVSPGHLVEAGLDIFQVVDSAATGISSPILSHATLMAYPNPFTQQACIQFKNAPVENTTIEISNALGQVVFAQKVNAVSGMVYFNQATAAGVYLVQLKQDNAAIRSLKLVRSN